MQSIEKYSWIIIISLSMFLYEKIYFVRHDFWGDAKRVIKALVLSLLIVFTVLTLTKISSEYSRILIMIFFTFAVFLVPLFKRIFKRLIFKIDFFNIKVKVLAKDKDLETIINEIDKNWYFGFKNSFDKYEMIIIASKSFKTIELQNLIKKYAQSTKDIYVVPYMDHLDFSHASIMDYSNIRLSAIHLENRLLNYQNIFIKYLFEKILVLLIFPFALVLHLFISLLIKLDSKGSVIYKQKRLGKNSQKFSCYKYRTMHENQDVLKEYLEDNPDEVAYYQIFRKYKNDPRITKIGNFLRQTSLDEFPQFYNIIRGNMNLIGPRPYMLDEEESIGTLNKDIILKVNPGITGLWQVSGRNELTFQERVDLDTWYIQNWSLWMDLVIFLKTIKVVLLKVGAR
ncbi:sugar transferase [Sulfurimonas sp.]|uniref:sugar transferase n=1 Tax=Sulfurimonas sp. TaxID=2022749 RepID=UPI0039E3E65B